MRTELLGSNLDALRTTESVVQTLLSQQVITNKQFGIVLMGLSEAVSLAVEKNNSTTENLTLEYAIQDTSLDFSVRFSDKILSNKTEKSLALIKSLAEEVVYKEGDGFIQMRFSVVSVQEKLNTQRAQILQKAKKTIQSNSLESSRN
jgi:hypothetical protein